MNAPRRRRTHIKTLDAVKAALAILGLLVGILVVLWFITRMHQHEAPPQDHSPRPATSLWEEPRPAH